ncbi:DUF4433 domain-containing protein [Saccharospirillum sp.]|uniref:type II toxin-antitoxin system toxin DNA ADP-ribosyl transferase DarT n=1 Tax=Saccharospirillum sp. TaxID=2033801 RepID=UPI0034A03D5D
MAFNYASTLNPAKALIWRIVHRHNMPWVITNGLHAVNSGQLAEDWVSIGNPELIDKRANHPVPVGPGGVLNDYVPFYFTPFSPMLNNIRTGYGGIVRRANDDIVILVSSLHELAKQNIPFVFTDSHAYYAWAKFYTELSDLNVIDWPLLQNRDFRRDLDDPGKFERYQAEALVYGQCPVGGLLGVFCHSDTVRSELELMINTSGLNLPVYTRPKWYFQ